MEPGWQGDTRRRETTGQGCSEPSATVPLAPRTLGALLIKLIKNC